MSAAAIPLVLAVGQLAVQALQTYNQAKAAQAAATVSDQAAIAELDKQIAANVTGADAAQTALDQDLGITSADVKALGGIGGTAQQL